MPDRPSFPIPEDLTPDTYCLCIQMPNDPTWKAVIAGLLFQPAEWFNWQRDDAKSGKDLAQYWRKIYAEIDWSTMSCCCDQIPLSRFTSDGVYQTSTDGGTTWVDNPNADPRNISPQLPPIPTTGSTFDDRCRSATNVVTAMSSAVEAFGAELGTVGSIIALAGAICLAVVGVFAVPPSATVLIPIVIALAQAIFSIASGTYLALFTDSVYNDLQCILYCNCPDDGTFTQENYNGILTAIDAGGFDANVALTFTSVIRGWSLSGLNSAARGGSTEAGDCSDCGCDTHCGGAISTITVCAGTDFAWVDDCTFELRMTALNGSVAGVWWRFGSPGAENHCKYSITVEGGLGTNNYGFTADNDCTTQADAVTYVGTSYYTGGLHYIGPNTLTNLVTVTIEDIAP